MQTDAMQTQCPECQTRFRLTQQQLDAADGQVRCSHCYTVFHAEVINDNSDIDTTDIDINTFVDGIEAPVSDPEDHLSYEGDTPVHEQAHPVSRNPAIDVEAFDDLVPPELRASRQPRKRSRLASFIWTTASLLLAIAAASQLLYFNRAELASNSNLRPHLVKLCQLAQCEIPELRDLQRLELSSKNVYSHPNVDKALMITAVIVNQAAFAQRFPVLQISFTNLVGDVIMARRFTPAEYLNTGSEDIDDMQPGLPIQITLEVVDPGTAATAYEFSFI